MAQGDILNIIKNRPGNIVFNGGFDIWQRGTSLSNAAGYLADRWYVQGSTNHNTTRQDVSASNLGVKYAIQMDTAADEGTIFQRIESANIRHLAGKLVTLSWYSRNLSGDATHQIALAYPTVEDNFSSLVNITTVDKTSENTGSFTRKTLTLTLPSDVSKGLQVNLGSLSNITGSNQITGVMLNEGPVAAPFERAGVSLTNELQLCQRYYEELNWAGSGYSYTSTGTAILNHARFAVEKRIAPVFTELNGNGDNNINIQAVAIQNPTYRPTMDVQINVTAASINSFWRLNNYHIACDAEL